MNYDFPPLLVLSFISFSEDTLINTENPQKHYYGRCASMHVY